MSRIVVLFLFVLFLSGCSNPGSGTVSHIAENTVVASVPTFAQYERSEEAIGYLADIFKEDNSFSAKESRILTMAESSLLNEFAYLQEITTISGAVPYYEYTASYHRITRSVKQMRSILDSHINNYPVHIRIIYDMTKENIIIIFGLMNVTIAKAQKGIDGESAEAMVSQLTQLYSAVKPLISTAAIMF